MPSCTGKGCAGSTTCAWGQFNDLLARGVDRKLGAPMALYLTATAHGYMALVSLRTLLDRNGVGLRYLLDQIAKTLPELVRLMADRDAAVRVDEAELRAMLALHEARLDALYQQARPALTLVDKMIVHRDTLEVRDPDAVDALLRASLTNREALTECFRGAEAIVNAWDLVWHPTAGAVLHQGHVRHDGAAAQREDRVAGGTHRSLVRDAAKALRAVASQR